MKCKKKYQYTTEAYTKDVTASTYRFRVIGKLIDKTLFCLFTKTTIEI